MNMGLTDSRAFDSGDADVALRPLGWSELCARLVAAQDLRRIQSPAPARLSSGPVKRSGGPDSHDPGLEFGSFHRVAALMLESYGPRQDFVNPTSSSSGKDTRGTPVVTREPSHIAREPRQADENRHD
jgi:hypothetical protein